MRRIRFILALSGCVLCSFAAALETKVEPVGPCSRKTGLAITEIMYHPASRADLWRRAHLGGGGYRVVAATEEINSPLDS